MFGGATVWQQVREANQEGGRLVVKNDCPLAAPTSNTTNTGSRLQAMNLCAGNTDRADDWNGG